MSANIIISVVGWLTIIIIYALFRGEESAKQEMVADGNNLFLTCFFYIIGGFACKYIALDWLCKIICFGMILFAARPSLSWLFLLFSKNVPTEQKFTAMICNVTPLAIGINCLFVYVY